MENIDVVLINPGDRKKVYQDLSKNLTGIEPPTFTLLIARYLINHNISVAVIDQSAMNYTSEEVAEMVKYYNPKLVGVFVYGSQPSASTQNMPAARLVCQSIKNLIPNMIIVMGGTHPAALPERTLLEEPVDFVCDREGFETIYQLVQNMKNFSLDSKLSLVPDVWTKGFNGRPKFTQRGKLLTTEELDKYVDRPAWELVELNGKLDHYRSWNHQSFDDVGRRSPYASIYTTLGCPFKCSFCCINAPFGNMLEGTRPYRFWSPEVIIKQIDMMVQKYGIRQIKFVDEMFVLRESHVFGITDLLTERGYDVNIWAYARVDHTKEKFLQRLKKAGINWLCLGIEAASKCVRDGADKVYNDDDIINVCKRIQDADIWILGNYIFGLPDDTMESMQDTLNLATELNCEFANFYSVMSYPGSPLYHQSLADGRTMNPSWSSYSQHSYDTFPLSNDHITNAQILQFRDDAHIAYFSNPKYQQMVLQKFGQSALDTVIQMLSYGKPKRKLLGQ